MSKKYLPNMAKSFASSKVTVVIGDGCEYLREHREEFNVIITDSSDPDGEFFSERFFFPDHHSSLAGPAQHLFEQTFYSLLKAALKPPSGVICCQGECIWLDLPLIKKLMTIARHLFPSVAYGNVSTPTYPCGTLGFLVCSLDKVYSSHSLFCNPFLHYLM